MLTVFTIVLNGEPWIRRILPELQMLKVPWQWRIVEGVSEPVNCTAWCRPVPSRWHDQYRSIDGTAAYLNNIRNVPGVTVTRRGGPYHGKLHMIQEALGAGPHEVVMQLDADELWTAQQMTQIHDILLHRPPGTAAQFFCRYFVGPNKIVKTRYGFSSYPYEWFRAWTWGQGIKFISHEPPRLNRAGDVISREVTESLGLVFDHMAYASKEQASFKEQFYGYEGLSDAWDKLQQTSGPVRLGKFFTWIHDATVVDNA